MGQRNKVNDTEVIENIEDTQEEVKEEKVAEEKVSDTSEKKTKTQKAKAQKTAKTEKKPVSKELRKQALLELVESGKKKGELSYKEIISKLEEIDMDAEHIEMVYEYLEKQGIEVIGNFEDEIQDIELMEEDLNITEEELSELSVPDSVSIDDPVRMYLK